MGRYLAGVPCGSLGRALTPCRGKKAEATSWDKFLEDTWDWSYLPPQKNKCGCQSWAATWDRRYHPVEANQLGRLPGRICRRSLRNPWNLRWPRTTSGSCTAPECMTSASLWKPPAWMRAICSWKAMVHQSKDEGNLLGDVLQDTGAHRCVTPPFEALSSRGGELCHDGGRTPQPGGQRRAMPEKIGLVGPRRASLSRRLEYRA